MALNSFEMPIELSVSAKRMWYTWIKHADYALPRILPEYINSVEYSGGARACDAGSARFIKFAEGRPHFNDVKEMVEEVDDDSYSATFRALEGGTLTQLCTHHVNRFKIIPMKELDFSNGNRMQEGRCRLVWLMEYRLMDGGQQLSLLDAYKADMLHIIKLVEEHLKFHDDYTCRCDCS